MNLNYLSAALLIPSLLFTAFSYALNNQDSHGAGAAGAVIGNVLLSGVIALFVALVAQSFWKRGFRTVGLPALVIFTILNGMVANYGDHRSFLPIVASAERSAEPLAAHSALADALSETAALCVAGVSYHQVRNWPVHPDMVLAADKAGELLDTVDGGLELAEASLAEFTASFAYIRSIEDAAPENAEAVYNRLLTDVEAACTAMNAGRVNRVEALFGQ